MATEVNSANGRAADGYFSALSRDPDLADLVEQFVADLPASVAEMRQAADAENWAAVGRLAHQLKGAGGSYGFPQITTAAGEVEEAVRCRGVVGDVEGALAQLVRECRRARAGIEPKTLAAAG